MLKNIFKPRDLSNVKSISHGKQKEKVAKTIYNKKMQKDVPKFTIFDAGISVHPSFSYLGVTPDGKVLDPSSAQTFGLLEIKCPFSKRNETLEQAVADKDFCCCQVLPQGNTCILCTRTRAISYYRINLV